MIITIYQMFEYMRKNFSNRIAFQYYDENNCKVAQITYEQYCDDVYGFASYIKETLQNAEGTHVGLLAHNSYRYLVCLFGILLGGGIAVPINPNDTWENIQAKIKYADVSSLLADSEISEMFDLNIYEQMLLDINGGNRSQFLQSDFDCCNEDNPCLMIFTSGVTGKNKCAMLSQRNIFAPMRAFIQAAEEGSKTLAVPTVREMLVQPFYHVSGIATVMNGNLMGFTLNMCNTLRYIYRDLQAMQSDYCLVMPVILEDFYKKIKRGQIEKLCGLRALYCGGASVDSDMFKVFADAGISVSQAYGLTEIFGGGTTNASNRPDKLKSVGVPGAGCEMKIENGEICFRSEAVMLGYYKDQQTTAEAIQDGWLHTGDLGYIDEDGFLYLTGRKKNLIILSNGENVSAEEVETELLKDPDIWETVVKKKDDKICAVVYCSADKQEQIRNYISESNRGKPLWKRITEVEFREEPFERTGTGKIIRSQ